MSSSSNPTPFILDSTEHVRLISSDGFEFIIDRKCAMVSGTIKSMLSSPGRFAESQQNLIEFKDIKAMVLEKVCQYLHYAVRYTNVTTDVPEFKFEPELALELFMAADFLDC